MTVRQLPPQETRVETGVVQFGDDWPGVFIRGDDAARYAITLNQGITKVSNPLYAAAISSLIETLESCLVKHDQTH